MQVHLDTHDQHHNQVYDSWLTLAPCRGVTCCELGLDMLQVHCYYIRGGVSLHGAFLGRNVMHLQPCCFVFRI